MKITKRDGKYGLLNNDKVVTPAIYDKIVNVRKYNTFITKLNNKFGVLDVDGAVIIEPTYQHICPATEGKGMPDGYEIASAEGAGYMLLNGKVVIPPKYAEFKKFSDSLYQAGIKDYGDIALYSLDGVELSKPDVHRYDDGGDGYIFPNKFVNYNFPFAIMDSGGNRLTKFIYTKIQKHKSGMFAALKGKKWGLVGIDGKAVTDFCYGEIPTGMTADGLAAVQRDGKYGYVDRNGKEVIPPQYENAGEFHNGYAFVTHDGENFGLINTKNELVIPIEYKALGKYRDGFIVCFKDDEFGYVDLNNILYTLQYDKASNKYMHKGLNGETSSESRIDKTRPFIEDSLSFEENGKVGFIDGGGNIIIPFVHDAASSCFWGGIAFVKKGDKWAFINRDGKLLTPYEFDKAGFIMPGYCMGVIGENRVLVKADGTRTTGNYKYIGYDHRFYNKELSKWEQSHGGDWKWLTFQDDWYLQDSLELDRFITTNYQEHSVLESREGIKYFKASGDSRMVGLSCEPLFEETTPNRFADITFPKLDFNRTPPAIIESAKIRGAKNKINPNYSSVSDPYYMYNHQSKVSEELSGVQNRFLLSLGAAISEWILWRVENTCKKYLNIEYLFKELDALYVFSVEPRCANLDDPTDDCEKVLTGNGITMEPSEIDEIGVVDKLLRLWNDYSYIVARQNLQYEVDSLVVVARAVLAPAKKKLFNDWLTNVMKKGREQFPKIEFKQISLYNINLDDVAPRELFFDDNYVSNDDNNGVAVKKFYDSFDWDSNPYLIKKESRLV